MADVEAPGVVTGGGRAARPAWRRAWPWVIGVLAVAIVAMAVWASRGSGGQAAMTPAQVSAVAKAAVDKGLADARSAPPDSAAVYEVIQPSLVLIRAERDGTGDQGSSSGAGVVINAQGAILTARHVVAGARAITVSFADGTTSSAKVISDVPENDIAVLMADQAPSVIVPAVMGRAGQVGDEAFAVGHPLGLVDSLSAGVISGLDRSIPVAGGSTLKGLIQFDAAVNPGSSGGPLLNRSGQVIGIVTALANPSQQGFFVGIGFAIPIGAASGAAGGPEQ